MSDSMNWRTRAPVDPNAPPPPRRNNYNSRGPREDLPPREGQADGRNPVVSEGTRNRSDDLRVHRPQRQTEDSPETTKAISEGRRIYLGNLLYSTTPDDIEKFLGENGFPTTVNVHVSVDPFSGRNPGYCFVEFADKTVADEAMEKLEGVPMFDRPVKCRPCQPKGQQRRAGQWPREENSSPSFDRWGSSDRSKRDGPENDRLTGRSGPNDALRHFNTSKAQEEGRQLYVGGLPRMLDQAENEVEIRGIFEGFEVDGVSKRVSPRESGDDQDSRRNFCFVDFATREQAQAAKDAVHGSSYRDGQLKVSEAVPKTERQGNDRYVRRSERSDNRDVRNELA